MVWNSLRSQEALTTIQNTVSKLTAEVWNVVPKRPANVSDSWWKRCLGVFSRGEFVFFQHCMLVEICAKKAREVGIQTSLDIWYMDTVSIYMNNYYRYIVYVIYIYIHLTCIHYIYNTITSNNIYMYIRTSILNIEMRSNNIQKCKTQERQPTNLPWEAKEVQTGPDEVPIVGRMWCKTCSKRQFLWRIQQQRQRQQGQQEQQWQIFRS